MIRKMKICTLLVVVLLNFCCGSVVIWRRPVDGYWRDPQNWRVLEGEDKGEIRIPREEDDVVLDVHNFNQTVYPELETKGVLTMAVRNPSITVNSLRVGSDTVQNGCPIAVSGQIFTKCYFFACIIKQA
eukprot:TRINITY_DN885_c0_g1_i12.p1 TRINITY_DN885_c0_g1~~TRINITY_DN885_c0_g1_i12.p1  ORF type:complete len:129 (-),score=17.44 TRINITY_DN885_c0_g1_i12:26-412(-)